MPESEDPPRGPREREGLDEQQVRRIGLIGALVLVGFLLLVFIVENSRTVTVSLVFFSADVSLIWVIVLSAAVGLIAGLALSAIARRRWGRRE